ncbi:polysaccharide biosynthesis/export family protein [Modicisalibacter tunisiensis]|uniref:polysaccharide export protein n=1 Tax=Modicisalibacter tunisiensis TaxID=390637 RepID=UPI001CCD9CE4|nr:polysaccharide export protein [Modicisalibacter tunisiensis]MBZ9538032.1 polysaccharide biosynthesis/export family protein [Modicisalibacter tunisiensis]
MMGSRRQALAVALTLGLLGGCAYAPGGYMDYNAESAPIDDMVDVEPITPGLVKTLEHEPGQPRLDMASARKASQRMEASGYDYRIGRGDVLNIIVYEHPELTIPAGSQRSAVESGNVVHADGTIFYPYIGRLQAAGRTVRDLRNEIQRRLAGYIAQPQVDVNVAGFNSQKTYVTGQVLQPGQFPITNVPLRLLDALSLAGGLAPTANWHDVVIKRDDREIHVSVYDMLNGGDLSDNLLLQDGDVIHVPDLGNQKVYVMGEVMRPGTLPVGESRISLTDALSQAGGMNESQADASGIFVVRRAPATSDKLATVYQLDARNAVALVLGAQFMLQPTDIVYVTTTPLGRWNRVVSQLLPTITAIYQVTQAGNDIQDAKSSL